MAALTHEKPSRAAARKRSPAAAAAPKHEESETRLLADIPSHIYMQVKLHCTEQRIPLRKFLLDLLAGAGFE